MHPLTGNANATYFKFAEEANNVNRLPVTGDNLNWYTVDNWQGSGRTMLIVNVKAPASTNYQLYQAEISGTRFHELPIHRWAREIGYLPPNLTNAANPEGVTNANFDAWVTARGFTAWGLPASCR
jgi:hypothetical protein